MALPAPAAELLRAAVHQLHQREAAAALQPHHVHPGAGGVPARGHRVELHRLRAGPAAVHRPHRETRKILSPPSGSRPLLRRGLEFLLAIS